MIIFGGSFNPPHLGHFHLLQYMKTSFPLDKILIIPNYQSPLKSTKSIQPHHILRMLELNFADLSNFEILSTEISKPKISYTIETLEEISSIYPKSTLSLMIGEDNYSIFHKWHRYLDILQKVQNLYVFSRFSQNIPKNLYLSAFSEKILFLQNPIFQGNSTEIRKSLFIDKKPFYLKESVLNYILENQLYDKFQDCQR